MKSTIERLQKFSERDKRKKTRDFCFGCVLPDLETLHYITQEALLSQRGQRVGRA